MLEAGDNPMAESSEEEEPAEDADAAEEEEADGPQKGKKKDKKKKEGSDDDATPRSTDLDLLDLDEDSDDDATGTHIAFCRPTQAGVRHQTWYLVSLTSLCIVRAAAKIASMSKGKTPRSVRQSGASDMDFNPVADGHNEDWAKVTPQKNHSCHTCVPCVC